MLNSTVADGIIDRVQIAGGKHLVLHHRGGVFTVRADGLELISSRGRGSEEALAELGCRTLAGRKKPKVLIGGLGIGYTLRSALDRLPGDAEVIVVERFTQVVRWHRELLGALVHHPLDDPRVTVAVGDVFEVLDNGGDLFDLILLDVDNGPGQLMLPSNHRLYGDRGIARIRASLGAGASMLVWSAAPAPEYVHRLQRGGFQVESTDVPVSDDVAHTLYLATRT